MVSTAKDDDPDAIRFRRGFSWAMAPGRAQGPPAYSGSCSTTGRKDGRKALDFQSDGRRMRSATGPHWAGALAGDAAVALAQGRDIPLTEGILFTTYATLRSEERGARKSRVDQIVDWLGWISTE